MWAAWRWVKGFSPDTALPACVSWSCMVHATSRPTCAALQPLIYMDVKDGHVLFTSKDAIIERVWFSPGRKLLSLCIIFTAGTAMFLLCGALKLQKWGNESSLIGWGSFLAVCWMSLDTDYCIAFIVLYLFALKVSLLWNNKHFHIGIRDYSFCTVLFGLWLSCSSPDW